MMKFSAARFSAILVLLLLVAWLGWTGGPQNAFDHDAILRLTALREASPGLTQAAILLTWLGSAYVTLGSGAAVAIWKLVERQRNKAIWLVATIFGGRLLADAAKLAVDRPRPHFTPYPVPVSSLSFPSGHATNTMLAFTTLAMLLPAKRRPLGITLAVLLSIIVGLTRPYLGVHWPSDVLAGWCLGGAVVLLAAAWRPSASRTGA